MQILLVIGDIFLNSHLSHKYHVILTEHKQHILGQWHDALFFTQKYIQIRQTELNTTFVLFSELNTLDLKVKNVGVSWPCNEEHHKRKFIIRNLVV